MVKRIALFALAILVTYLALEVLAYHLDQLGRGPVHLGFLISLFIATILFLRLASELEAARREILADQAKLTETEEALRKALGQQDAILTNIPDIAWLKDLNCRFVAINEPFAKFIGKTRQEVIGLDDFDLFPKDQAEHFRKDDLAIMQNGQALRIDEQISNKDGALRWIETIKLPVFDASHRVIGTTGLAHDITERKRIESELEYERMLLNSFVEHSVDHIYFKDRASRFIRVNKALVQHMGRQPAPSEADFIGKTDFDFFPQADAKVKFDDEQRIIATGEPIFWKDELDLPVTGGSRWVSTIKMPLRDKAGEIIGTFGVSRDITDLKVVQQQLEQYRNHLEDLVRTRTAELEEDIAKRKAVEEQLRRSEENLVITLNSLAEAVIAADASGIITHMNPVAETLTGWPAALAKGHAVSDVLRIVDGRTRSELGCLFQPVDGNEKAGAADPAVDEVLISRDGLERAIEHNGAPIRDREGRIVGSVTVFRDVSERKNLERQLRHSERMQAIGQLAGGIAHDFNNQIMGIQGCAELLRLLVNDQDAQHYVDLIVAASNRSADLTAKLLAFARKSVFQVAAVNIAGIVAEVVALLERTIDRRITVTYNTTAPETLVRGDASQIQSAILNLALNARDALPEGGTIMIETEPLRISPQKQPAEVALESGSYVIVTVSDNGIGMSEETQAHVFEPFFTTKTEGKGTGMGLAAVYGMAKSHCGAVTFTSELGKGSTFKLFLPVAEGLAEQRDITPSPVAAGSGRILVVDDEEVVRRVTVDMLVRLGYQVHSCANGDEAVRYYRDNWRNVDAVLLDMIMPKQDGRDTYTALRTINSHSRVILMSGFSLDHSVQETLQRGAIAFLQKPFTFLDLSKRLADVLREETKSSKASVTV